MLIYFVFGHVNEKVICFSLSDSSSSARVHERRKKEGGKKKQKKRRLLNSGSVLGKRY